MPCEGVTFLQDVQYYPCLERASDLFMNVDSRLRVALTEAMFAQFQWVLDYDNTPSTNSSGVEQDRLDHRFLISAGWSF